MNERHRRLQHLRNRAVKPLVHDKPFPRIAFFRIVFRCTDNRHNVKIWGKILRIFSEKHDAADRRATVPVRKSVQIDKRFFVKVHKVRLHGNRPRNKTVKLNLVKLALVNPGACPQLILGLVLKRIITVDFIFAHR